MPTTVNPNTSVTKLGWNSLYCLFVSFSGCTIAHTQPHSRTDSHTPKDRML